MGRTYHFVSYLCHEPLTHPRQILGESDLTRDFTRRATSSARPQNTMRSALIGVERAQPWERRPIVRPTPPPRLIHPA